MITVNSTAGSTMQWVSWPQPVSATITTFLWPDPRQVYWSVRMIPTGVNVITGMVQT